jgi:hypothetical protein
VKLCKKGLQNRPRLDDAIKIPRSLAADAANGKNMLDHMALSGDLDAKPHGT